MNNTICVRHEVFNTANEAKAYVETYCTETPVILCTSAIHMKRSVKWFAHYGVKTIHPTPAYYQAPHQPIVYSHFLPSWKSFEHWQNWLKETLGTTDLVFKVQSYFLRKKSFLFYTESRTTKPSFKDNQLLPFDGRRE